MRTRASLLALLAVAGIVTVAAADSTEEVPPGVEQLLPRGKIAAVFEPTFVPAGAADIPSEARILGVAIDGEARAFSLNLLNRHEVVNDTLSGSAYAAVW